MKQLRRDIENRLKKLGIEVRYKVRPKNTPGISFHEYGTSGEIYTDGDLKIVKTNIQIDLWSGLAVEDELINKIKKNMKNKNYRYKDENSFFEDDVKLHHFILIYSIYYRE